MQGMSARWDMEAARMAIPEVARRKLAKLALARNALN